MMESCSINHGTSLTKVFSNCPLVIFMLDSCLMHFSKTLENTSLKYHNQLYLVQDICSAQELLTFFDTAVLILSFFSRPFGVTKLKLQTWTELIIEEWIAQE